MQVYTVGYEGTTIERFVAALIASKIQTLVDVREVAISRKKGFSKKALASALSEVGIDYVHLKALGDPKPGREAAKRGDFTEFKKIFTTHLETDVAQESLDELREIIGSSRVCLLCFEKDPCHCHRNIVASRLESENNAEVSHIFV